MKAYDGPWLMSCCRPAQVTGRWEKFTEQEHAQLAGMAFSLFQQGALSDAWFHEITAAQ